ncbi:MAG: ScaI family restriction endonuclease [Saprospiraceae bacterium]
MNSPYHGVEVENWQEVTNKLIAKHPLSDKEIIEVVLKSWDDIFNSQIGSFSIGKEIFPTPQIMSFFLHELVAHYLSLRYRSVYRVGVAKNEKDIHHITNQSLSVEIKGSSNKKQIFGNRSYAQPNSGKGQKDKNGYYITINFEKFPKNQSRRPEILIIRFGYLEHTDWIAQKSSTGQQARLGPDVYKYKLKELYNYDDMKKSKKV